jgi:cation diffusion facilitator family transporter
MWLAIGAAIVTILLKSAAYLLTGSVGLLSDALEGFVNLAAAVAALLILRVVERPPDEGHEFGHDKAGYFSSGIEGTLIGVAAATIIYTAIRRLLEPQPIEQPGIGLAIAVGASLINLAVGQLLIRVGKREDSIVLEADGHHLMSDVWTSLGVVVGVTLAVWTGLTWLDPAVALVMGGKIGWEGLRILGRSLAGLMDTALPAAERTRVESVLNRYRGEGIRWHALRTRQSGARRFIAVHVLAPGDWSLQRAHDLVEQIEGEIRELIPNAVIVVHLEPSGDPVAEHDTSLDRGAMTAG